MMGVNGINKIDDIISLGRLVLIVHLLELLL